MCVGVTHAGERGVKQATSYPSNGRQSTTTAAARLDVKAVGICSQLVTVNRLRFTCFAVAAVAHVVVVAVVVVAARGQWSCPYDLLV